MTVSLRMTGKQHAALVDHLYPGDGLEAVAVGVCGRHRGDHGHVLTLQDVVHIPHDECRRTDIDVTWSTSRLEKLLVRAIERDLAVVKFHCHPGGFARFSAKDDRADADLFGSGRAGNATAVEPADGPQVRHRLPHVHAMVRGRRTAFGRPSRTGEEADPHAAAVPADAARR